MVADNAMDFVFSDLVAGYVVGYDPTRGALDLRTSDSRPVMVEIMIEREGNTANGTSIAAVREYEAVLDCAASGVAGSVARKSAARASFSGDRRA
jgi:hypothetical protein